VLWVLLTAVLALAGLAVVGALCWRLWQQVRRLGREVARAGDRLAAATAALDQVARPGPDRSPRWPPDV